MERWTRAVIANRKKVIAGWLVLFALGGYAASHLGDLLSNRFGVPGSDSERGLDIAKERFNERGDGAFTLVFETTRPIAGTPAFRREAKAATAEAATAIDGATPGALLPASPRIAYAQINTPLENEDASKETPDLRAAIPRLPGTTTYLSGSPAAILLDATIVRAILVPALMKLMGDWNWYLPKRVERALERTRRHGPVEAEG